MWHSRSIILFLLLQCLLLQPRLAASQELDDESSFNYDECSPLGPNNWGNLNENWRKCGIGEQQSPIDVNYWNVQPNLSLKKLSAAYDPAFAVLKNRGHDIMVQWPNGTGKLGIDGKNYFLRQCHWHSPSEHTFNGIRYSPPIIKSMEKLYIKEILYPLEMHMVHTSETDNEVAVVGIAYKLGKPDGFITNELMSKLRDMIDSGSNSSVVGSTLPPLMEKNSPYYRYLGSLTTPPCTEGVIWTLLKQVRTVSQEQLNLLREAVHWDDNSRPIQHLYGRTVSLYDRPWAEHASS